MLLSAGEEEVATGDQTQSLWISMAIKSDFCYIHSYILLLSPYLLSLRMQLALSACVVVCKGTVKWTVDVG